MSRTKKGDGMVGDLVDKILPTRKDFPPKVRKVIKENESKKITSITVGRSPVNSLLTKALNLLSQGKLQEQQKSLNYDKLFHLFMLVGLSGDRDGSCLLVEKNSVVNIKKASPSFGDHDEKVSVDITKNITFGDMINDAVKAVGNSLYLYNATNNNCQIFIENLLKHSGLLTPSLKTFITQDIEKVLSTSPLYVKKLADIATEGSAKIDRLIEGGRRRGGRKILSGHHIIHL